MATTTLRPNGDVTGSVYNSGAAPYFDELSDQSDASFVGNSAGDSTGIFTLQDLSLPSGSVVNSVRPYLRWLKTSATLDAGRTGVYLGDGANTDTEDQFTNSDTVIHEDAGAARTTAPDGGPWTEAKVNALRLHVRCISTNPGVQTRMYEAYVVVDYTPNQVPTVTVTGPTGRAQRTNPTISWSFSDPDGHTQGSYRARIYDGASVVWDSGVVASAATSVASSINLRANGDYTAKVIVTDAVGGSSTEGELAFITESGAGGLL